MTVCVKLEFDKQTYDVWLTEILETFPRVFSCKRLRIKENGGNVCVFRCINKLCESQKRNIRNKISFTQEDRDLRKWLLILISICFFLLQPGVEPGDVILVLQQKDHDLFTRQGDDLFMTKKLHLAEALCGFHMVIKHLDKRDLIIKYPAGQVIEPG